MYRTSYLVLATSVSVQWVEPTVTGLPFFTGHSCLTREQQLKSATSVSYKLCVTLQAAGNLQRAFSWGNSWSPCEIIPFEADDTEFKVMAHCFHLNSLSETKEKQSSHLESLWSPQRLTLKILLWINRKWNHPLGKYKYQRWMAWQKLGLDN